MSIFDLDAIPASSRAEADEIFKCACKHFHMFRDVRLSAAPPIAPRIYWRAEAARRRAFASMIDYHDFVQYVVAVGEFCALVSLLEDILK